MERKKHLLQKDIQHVFIASIVTFVLLIFLLVINTWPLIKNSTHHELINGFLTGLLLVIFLFSLGGLKFESIIKKTVLKYQINAFLWRFIAVLTFFLKALNETPNYSDYLLIGLLAVVSLRFDYLAIETFKKTDINTLKKIVKKYNHPLKDASIKQYQANKTLLKKTAFLAVVYFFIIGGFDYTLYFQFIFLLFTVVILFYQYVRLVKTCPSLNMYVRIAVGVSFIFLSLQFVSYHYWAIDHYVYHFVLLWLGFSPIFLFYVFFQTKLQNHQNIALFLESHDT